MAHRGPAKIPGADDRPTGRQPGGLVSDPGLSYSSKQFGGQVGEALAVEGGKFFTMSQKFAKADRASALLSAKADFDAEVTKIETGFESRTDHANFEFERSSALAIKSADIESRISGEVLRAFKSHAASSNATSKARVTATGRKRMVTSTRAQAFNAGTVALGKALSATNADGANFERDTYFFDLDQLGAANIYSAEEVATLKLAFKDDLAKGQLSKIILANPFDPNAELAIKNLRPPLQAAASKQLQTARSSWVTKENLIESRRVAAAQRLVKKNRMIVRRNMLIILNKFDENDDDERERGLAAAEKLLEKTIMDSPLTSVDAATIDHMRDDLKTFREGRVSPPGALGEALTAINQEELVSEDDYRFKVLSHTDRLTVSRRLATKNAEGQKHFSAQDFWKQGNDLIKARIEAANPIAPNANDLVVLKNQIAIKVKLAQALYSARAYDAKDRGEMMQDLARLKEGKYNVFNEVEEIVNIAATAASAEIQIKILIEEKNVILEQIREQKMAPLMRLEELQDALRKEAGAVELEGPVILPPGFEVGGGKVDPALESRVTFLDQRINILDSLGTSPETPPAGRQSLTRVR